VIMYQGVLSPEQRLTAACQMLCTPCPLAIGSDVRHREGNEITPLLAAAFAIDGHSNRSVFGREMRSLKNELVAIRPWPRLGNARHRGGGVGI